MKTEHLGFLINSALYLSGLIAAGLVAHSHFVVLAGLVSAGACTVSYYGQSFGQMALAKAGLAVSWVAGVVGIVDLVLVYHR